jgi:EAL domain-containing protein (putative c-di-GMP-specific phosphodiesterase class I)
MSNAEVVGDIIGYLNSSDFNSGERHHDQPFYIADNSIHADYAGFRLSSQFQPIVLQQKVPQQNVLQQRALQQNASEPNISQISDNDSHTVAYEALLAVRTTRGLLPLGDVLSPHSVFALPDCNGEITLLDRLTRTLHALNFLIQGVPADLHLNVHSDHLLAVDTDHGRVFERILRQCGLEPSAIVLEVSEYSIRDKARLRSAIANWQSRGYRIAADNFGLGHTQLARVLDLSIDILKIDRSLLQAAQQNRRAAEALAKIAMLCNEHGVRTIATAAETAVQQQLIEQSGIDYAQGFLFGSPAPDCQAALELAPIGLRVSG